MLQPWYDIVYASKVFSDAYSPDFDWASVTNAGEIRKGGTGYCISLDENGREVFDQSKNVSLPPEIEKMFPDYSIYPDIPFAVSMTSRGCPRGCSFCHVAAKEGKCAVKVANVSDFWTPDTGKKEIKVLDPNITACREKRDLMRQYRETGCWIDFTQGIDIRLVNEADMDDLQAAVSRDRRDDLPVPADVAEAYLVMRYYLEAGCFCFVDADGHAETRSYYDGKSFTDDPEFEEKLKAALSASEDFYVCTVDLHD